MADEKTKAPDAVETLKDYEYERLDAATEIRAFARQIENFERAPSFPAAEALCRGSRRLRFAIREDSYDFASKSLPSQQHLKKTLLLFEKAVAKLSHAIPAIPHKDRTHVKRFLDSIAKRKRDLGRIRR